MMPLFVLPQSLVIVLVSEWIDWKALSKLDVAVCNGKLRPRWWSFIGDDVVIFPASPQLNSEVSCGQFMAWSIRRTVKIQRLILTDQTQFTDLPLCLSYIELQLPRLTAITFKKLPEPIPAEVCLLLCSCPNLRSIRALGCRGLEDVAWVAAGAAPQLEELHFYQCWMTPGAEGLATPLFPRLRDFYIDNCAQLPDVLLERIYGHCPALTRITAFGQLTDAALTNLAPHNSRLQIASLSGCRNLTDAGLAPFLQRCSSLVTCDICCNNFVGDTSVLALVRHCPQLRALAIGGNASFTDASAIAIAQHAGSRLQVLHLGRGAAITNAGVTVLAQHCTALYSLLVTSRPHKIRPDVMASWVSKCPAMAFLDIGNCQGVKEILAAVAKSCPQLQLLNVFSTQISAQALQEVARGCPLLRVLAVYRSALRPQELQELKGEFPLLDIQHSDVTIPYWAKFSYTFTDPL